MRKYFSISVSLLLVFTATAKLVALFQHKKFLLLPDPVFSSIMTRDTMILAVILEIMVAVFMFYKRKSLSAMVACSWVVSIFVCYRMLERAFFAKKPCHCLGGVLDWTGLPQKVIDAIPIATLCYMGIGSLFFLVAASVLTARPPKAI
jgi:hypothetical protein